MPISEKAQRAWYVYVFTYFLISHDKLIPSYLYSCIKGSQEQLLPLRGHSFMDYFTLTMVHMNIVYLAYKDGIEVSLMVC